MAFSSINNNFFKFVVFYTLSRKSTDFNCIFFKLLFLSLQDIKLRGIVSYHQHEKIPLAKTFLFCVYKLKLAQQKKQNSHHFSIQTKKCNNLSGNSLKDDISLLPTEIFLLIFRNLDCKDLCAVCCVNKSWKQITSDERLWRNLAKRTLLVVPPQRIKPKLIEIECLIEKIKKNNLQNAINESSELFKNVPVTSLYVVKKNKFIFGLENKLVIFDSISQKIKHLSSKYEQTPLKYFFLVHLNPICFLGSNENYLLSASTDGVAAIWSHEEKLINSFTFKHKSSCQFFLSNQYFCVLNTKSIKVYELPTGKHIGHFKVGIKIKALAICDGKIAVVPRDSNMVFLWDFIKKVKIKSLVLGITDVLNVYFFDDNLYVVLKDLNNASAVVHIFNQDFKTILIIDKATGKYIRTKDKFVFVETTDNKIAIYNLLTKKLFKNINVSKQYEEFIKDIALFYN